jgi:pimeloyl-ACP methyl ester carboxylesterase
MNTVEIRPGVALAYEDDWFGAPWTAPQCVVMIHGNAESSRAWFGWVPRLAARWRVIRPDLPGFGASPAPEHYGWSVGELAADIGISSTRWASRSAIWWAPNTAGRPASPSRARTRIGFIRWRCSARRCAAAAPAMRISSGRRACAPGRPRPESACDEIIRMARDLDRLDPRRLGELLSGG